ncbi:MAG TPA: hypothetical protein VIQ01_00970, partial [Burkholderiales bacterium]
MTSLVYSHVHVMFPPALPQGAFLAALKGNHHAGVNTMAELDKGRSEPVGGYSPQSPPGEGATTWTAGSSDSASVGASSDTAQSFNGSTEQAKQAAADMAARAKEQGRQMFSGQKEKATGQMDSVARALRNTAEQLSNEDQSQTAQYVGFAAEQLESFGQRLREKDLDTLINDAQNIARRSPTAFFAGSVVAGFLLARFLKSSAERQADPDRYSGQ